MGLDALCADEGVADEQGGGAEAVEQGIECGQKGVLGAGRCSGMNVDEPEEKGVAAALMARMAAMAGRVFEDWASVVMVS